jgi:hypothetical protein
MQEKVRIHSCRRLAKFAIPFNQASSVGNRPSAAAPLKSINISAAHEIYRAVLPPKSGKKVRFDVRNIPVKVDRLIRDIMVVHIPVPGVAVFRVLNETTRIADISAVVVGCISMVCLFHNLVIVPVDASRIAQRCLAYRFPVEQCAN